SHVVNDHVSFSIFDLFNYRISTHLSCSFLTYLQLFFFFNGTAPSEIYTLSLHDALPISYRIAGGCGERMDRAARIIEQERWPTRSEEHTSELQSRGHLVCRLLLEKKKQLFDVHGPYQVQAHLRDLFGYQFQIVDYTSSTL